MSADSKTSLVLVSLSVAFVALAALFQSELFGKPKLPAEVPLASAVVTNTGTIRFSANDLIKAEGDVSGMDCYACHEEGKEIKLPIDENGVVVLPKEHADLIFGRRNCAACHDESEAVEIKWDDDGNVILPEFHKDLVIRHGRNNRNNGCFNCHVNDKLNELQTRNGERLKLTESTRLCASCHGPTYSDWEAGIHGRTSGYWNRDLGEASRKECTSCHDPHAPIFPSLKPAPKPHALHAGAEAEATSDTEQEH